MNKQGALELLRVLNNLTDLLGSQHARGLAYKIEHDLIPWFDEGPIKQGDRVALTKTPEINETVRPGWRASKHTLVEGRVAVVVEVELVKGRRSYGLEFENETWISSQDGLERPVDRPGLYYFHESWVRKVES